MDVGIYVVTILLAAAGVAFAVWTFFDTRKRYYDEFVKRKSKREKFHLS